MKISKIYISAFGGLKDFTLELNENMNVIFGENENGKTTVMSFILAMFYGTGSKTKSIANSPRVKYAPFDGSAMGGRIYFKEKLKEFCLERQFIKSDSTDKVTLTDMDTGESVSVPSDIGSKLFGMGAESFKSSMFIGAEKGLSLDSEAIGELNARLSSIAVTGDENTSFERVENRIEKAKEKVLSKSGKTGLLARSREQLEALNERLKTAKNDVERKSEIARKTEELIKKGQQLSEEYIKYKKITDAKEDIKNTEKLKEFLSLKAELEKLNETLKTPDGKIIDSQFVSKVKFCLGKLEQQKEKCKILEGDIENLLKTDELEGSVSAEDAKKKIEEGKEKIEKYENERNKLSSRQTELEEKLATAENTANTFESQKKPFNAVLFIFGAVCVLFGGISGIIINPFLFISAGLGGLLLILSFVFKPNIEAKILEQKEAITEIKNAIAELKEKAADIGEKITAEIGKINIYTSVLSADETLKAKRNEDLKLKKERLAEESEKLEALNEEYAKILGGMAIDSDKLSAMEKSAEAGKDLKLKLNYLSKDLGNISYEEAKLKLEKNEVQNEFSGTDFEQAEQKREEIGEEMTSIREQITALQTELKTSFRNSEQPEILEREIKDLNEKAESYSEFVESCAIASEVLAESFASIRAGYGSTLEDKTLENFSRLTKGKYGKIGINKSFDITVEDKNIFGMREIDYLSTGTADQAVLALRLAVCELIGTGKTPIMLDDALSNYDDERTEQAIRFLKEFSSENQVVLFTCHKSVVESAKQNGIEAKNLI